MPTVDLSLMVSRWLSRCVPPVCPPGLTPDGRLGLDNSSFESSASMVILHESRGAMRLDWAKILWSG